MLHSGRSPNFSFDILMLFSTDGRFMPFMSGFSSGCIVVKFFFFASDEIYTALNFFFL